MKTILRAILGVTMAVSPLLAGQDPTEKEKQKQDDTRKQPPPNQQQEPQPPEKPKPKAEKPQPEPATPPKQQKTNEKQQQQQEQDKQKQEKEEEKKSKDSRQQGQTEQQNSRTQQSPQASQGKGQRIPSEKFQSNFGNQHYFQVQDLQDGRRFQHAGYWFEIVEVWPADWSYHDLCYIGEDAGEYYIADMYHPGVRVSVIVVDR
jgi:outer membrane biosynthesis protein TonB